MANTPPSTAIRRGLPLLVYELLTLILLVLPQLVSGIIVNYITITLLGVMVYTLISKYGKYIIEIRTIPDAQILLIVISATIGFIVGVNIIPVEYLQYAIATVLVAGIVNLLEFASVLK